MLIIPAIDLKDGCVVRLLQGKFDAQKTYSRDPLKAAKHWAAQGAELIHVVDLDGAATGVIANFEIVSDIARQSKVGIEFGGGVRDDATIKKLLDCGVQRVVLGTRAAQDRDFLKRAFSAYGKKVIVSIDASGGRVAINGWQNNLGGATPEELAVSLAKIGFKEFIYTDTLKDGTLSGPNIKSIKAMLKAGGIGIIASGGISCLADITRLKNLEKSGLTGIIIGKALYEGKFTLKEAIDTAA